MIYDDGMMQVGGRDEGTIRNALEKIIMTLRQISCNH